ncbi:AAA family ATPase [Amphritea sp.]|uniref:ExeA family protein n=1 Tax=Amphritea sp. TaxID=1872502 RepID=UPI0025C573B1|nr:AAA family ATPase [Amphritea sp.]
MYEEFYGFTEKPFTLQTDPSLLYMGKSHTAAFAMLEYGLLNQAGFSVITGEIGAGKTTLVARLLDSLDEDQTVGLLNNTHENMGELLPWVLHSFGQDYLAENQIVQYDQLRYFLNVEYDAGRHSILIIDEAQNLSIELLEQLRTLSNINFGARQILQIVLVGQPELRDKLRHPKLKQFVQRVAVDYHVPVLSLEETVEYLEHRMLLAGRKEPLLTAKACHMMHFVSGGVPRILNVVCDTVLSYGFADQQLNIDEVYVRSVLKNRAEGGLLALGCEPKVMRKRSQSQYDE